MSTAEDNHDKAMNAFDKATLAKLRGDMDVASAALKEALRHETVAAELLFDDLQNEPSRSVLFRSAASIALQCGEKREAERLIARGLGGDPPAEIAAEMRDLLEDVYFERHLETQGIQLLDREIQFSLSGDAVGWGKIESDVFITKLRSFEKLLYRTAERKQNMPYREQAGTSRVVKRDFEIYMSVPRAASFAVSLRIGQHGEQGALQFDRFVDEVINDVFKGLQAIEQDKPDELRRVIPDKKYNRNFVALARELAPQHNVISQVGFTIQAGREQRKLALRRKRSDIRLSRYTKAVSVGEDKKTRVHVEGVLRFADETVAKKPRIKVIDDNGVEHMVLVREGMMADIVRPLWGYYVRIDGWRTERTKAAIIVMDDIVRVRE